MQAKYRHYIWDFDGTLFDSYPHICYAFCKQMQALGRVVDPTEADTYLRRSFEEARIHFAVPLDAYKAFQVYQRKDFDPPILPYPQLRDTLVALLDAGAKHYIYTHRDQGSLSYYLDKYGFSEYFFDRITSDDGFPRKPAPDAITALLERHGLSKEDCVMVGDRELDIGSAKAAGIAACLFDERALAPETAADHTVTSLAQIPQL